ncbi:hypothetical protein ACIP02_06695 [Pseudomonas sp. NPDC089408]|uniref:hypothetical protein n=1 Tax=Pseudomonas sp. NPDC089408 TaxID=3364465 RepID=UPI0037F496B6
MEQKNRQNMTSLNSKDADKVLFTQEELQALSDAINKSKTRVSETKAASCAYHR